MEISPNKVGLAGILGDWHIEIQKCLDYIKGLVQQLIEFNNNRIIKNEVLTNIMNNGLENLKIYEYAKIQYLLNNDLISIHDIVIYYEIRLKKFGCGELILKKINPKEINIYDTYCITKLENYSKNEESMLIYDLLKDYVLGKLKINNISI